MLGYRIERLAETTSTNTVALAAAAGGEPEGLVVVADHQTAGRGRLDRAWVAAPGTGLLVSILLRPPLEAAHLAVSAVACAAAAACERAAGVTPALKWPNDLVVGDAKLGGILAETAGNVACVVVGLGLNVHVPPDRPASIAAIDLDTLAGRGVPRDAVLDALLMELVLRYSRLGDVLDEYRARCITIGRQVRVSLAGGSLAGGSLVGRAVAVADDGSLVVSRSDGGDPVTVSAGDVIHLR